MSKPLFHRRGRPQCAAACLLVGGVSLTAVSAASPQIEGLAEAMVRGLDLQLQRPNGPAGVGDVEVGALSVPLYRGAATPFELLVPATPNNCENDLLARIRWDAGRNRVWVHLTGEAALEPFPDVDRTEGVDFFPNPFFPEPEDIVDGRYQLWIVTGAGPLLDFYYDGATLDLLGSELDFEAPPEGSIPVPFPTLYLFGSPFFQPDPNGDVDLRWEFAYDAVVRGDRPELTHFYVTFPPPNLCLSNPFRLDLSTLRPYISEPLPASEARPWSDYLRGGLLFDVTIEPSEYFVEPPLNTLIGTHQGATVVGGGIPRGWQLDIDAAFMGVAPPIRPWAGAGRCENTYTPQHDPGINFCVEP